MISVWPPLPMRTATTRPVTLPASCSRDDPDALAGLDGVSGLADLERYDGVLEPHAPLLLPAWTSLTDARAGTPPLPAVRVRHARVIREYGLRDRREAPQYFPDVT